MNELNRRLVRFWCDDTPPMNDFSRIVFYTGLFVIALTSKYYQPPFGESPLQAPQVHAYTLPNFFTPYGLLHIVDKCRIRTKLLKSIWIICIAAWISCIIGFGANWSALLLGICMLALHGVSVGCFGLQHGWFAPVYALLALAFSNGNGPYSLDGYFSARFDDDYPFQAPPPSGSLLASGFGRKVGLATTFMMLFLAGLAKLLNSGKRYMDGKTLAWHLRADNCSSFPARLILAFPVIAKISTVLAVGFELFSICALFVPWIGRVSVVLSALLFHYGIYAIMYINFIAQAWCYLLGFQCGAASSPATAVVTSTVLASWGITLFLVFWTILAFRRIDLWPLSSVSMFSCYRDETFTNYEVADLNQVDLLIQDYRRMGITPDWRGNWVDVRLTNSLGDELYIFDYASTKETDYGIHSQQWVAVLFSVVAQDLLAKSNEGQKLQYSRRLKTKYPAQVWLERQVKVWRSERWSLSAWTFSKENDVKLQLLMRLKKRSPLILAETPWLDRST